jgi:hypothetical protein
MHKEDDFITSNFIKSLTDVFTLSYAIVPEISFLVSLAFWEAYKQTKAKQLHYLN